MKTKSLMPIEKINRSILVLRGQKVMLATDLADLYGVTTKRLNEQVKRNRGRFPVDFMFRLTAIEKAEVVANCDHLQKLKFSPILPYAFTEHGALMLASVLNSRVAIQVSIEVVRIFIRMREVVTAHKDLARRLAELEKKYDSQFKVVFDAIRQLMEPAKPRPRRIGFQARTWQRADPSHAALRSQNATLARGRGQHRKYVPSHEVTMSTYR